MLTSYFPPGRSRAGAVSFFVLLAAVALPAGATTLHETLATAYRNNARLQAERSALDATEDQVDTAQSGWKPRVNVTASAGRTHIDGTFSSIFGAFSEPGAPSVLPLTLQGSAVGIAVQQPLYEGGRTSAAINQAQSLVSVQQAKLQNTEQEVFLSAAQAYINVLTDQAVLRLERHNVKVLKEQLQSAQANFNNGEATRTDVAQSEARLAGARAQVIQARGDLREARATYRRVVGVPAQNLQPPAELKYLPASLAEARQLAAHNYPVIAAKYAVQAAHYNVETLKSRLSPSLALTGSYTHANDPQFAFAQLNQAQIALTLSIPIYQGGALHAQTSQARHLAAQRHNQLIDAERRAVEQATRAWQALQTASAALKAIQSQISAAQIAFKGVTSEHRVGERTQLDVLNAQQDLLTAQVSLARARGNMRIAAYALKAATGNLTADAMLPDLAATPALGEPTEQ
ncbi:MAG TPA: TolC family outer membrane protein [Gammaproteobacteria bacterium]|nr:TolC family outer membrane protein [Gammaproteobacteria bacterium]